MRLLIGCLAAGCLAAAGCGNDSTLKDQGALNTMQEAQQREVDDAERAMQKENQPKGARKK